MGGKKEEAVSAIEKGVSVLFLRRPLTKSQGGNLENRRVMWQRKKENESDLVSAKKEGVYDLSFLLVFERRLDIFSLFFLTEGEVFH